MALALSVCNLHKQHGFYFSICKIRIVLFLSHLLYKSLMGTRVKWLVTESLCTDTNYWIKIIPHCHSDRHQWPDAKSWLRLKAIQINSGPCLWIQPAFLLMRTIWAHESWLLSLIGPLLMALPAQAQPPSNMKSGLLVVGKQHVGNCNMCNINLFSLFQLILQYYLENYLRSKLSISSSFGLSKEKLLHNSIKGFQVKQVCCQDWNKWGVLEE